MTDEDRATYQAPPGGRRRLEQSGLRVFPPVTPCPPGVAEVLDANRGSGTAVSDALCAERDAR